MLGFKSSVEISGHSPPWQLSSKLPDQPWTLRAFLSMSRLCHSKGTIISEHLGVGALKAQKYYTIL